MYYLFKTTLLCKKNGQKHCIFTVKPMEEIMKKILSMLLVMVLALTARIFDTCKIINHIKRVEIPYFFCQNLNFILA